MNAALEVFQPDMTVENLDQTTAEQMGDPSNGLGQDTSGSSVKSSRSCTRSAIRLWIDKEDHGSNESTVTSSSTSHVADSLPQIPHPKLHKKARAFLSKVSARKVSIA